MHAKCYPKTIYGQKTDKLTKYTHFLACLESRVNKSGEIPTRQVKHNSIFILKLGGMLESPKNRLHVPNDNSYNSKQE